MVYQNLANIKEDKEYWDKYIKFHELYWDGPNASQNVFYGNEYEEYRNSLSKYLEIEPDQIKDCLFTKHENGDYYLTPLGVDSDKYIMESENSIPAQWFLMFESKEKKFFIPMQETELFSLMVFIIILTVLYPKKDLRVQKIFSKVFLMNRYLKSLISFKKNYYLEYLKCIIGSKNFLMIV